jgi:endonuclease-3
MFTSILHLSERYPLYDADMSRSPKISVATVLRKLKPMYPNAACTLDWGTPLDLLVATILSAQCTDKRVNIVTKTLFPKYKTPQDYLRVPVEELEDDIHSCGTFHMKAKAIRESCKTLIKDFGGEVPKTMEEMLTLRGVGRKTASVVLATVYGVIEGIPVDTHVMRLSHRFGLTREKTQAKIEKDLMKKTQKEDWVLLSHLLVAHGRAVCTARTACTGQCIFTGRHDLIARKGSSKRRRV